MSACRIHIGSRVEGLFGPLVPNPTGNKRRVRTLAVGTVIATAGHHKWNVFFDYNGKSRTCASGSLKIVSDGAGIPLSELQEAQVSSCFVI